MPYIIVPENSQYGGKRPRPIAITRDWVTAQRVAATLSDTIRYGNRHLYDYYPGPQYHAHKMLARPRDVPVLPKAAGTWSLAAIHDWLHAAGGWRESDER